jgi:hypothetical protein
LTNDELAIFHELSLLLDQVHPGAANSDRRRWIPDAADVFTVKSTYTHLLNISGSDQQLDPTMEHVLKKLWSANVPSKVGIFGWRMLLGKLPTREALYSKGIITNQLDRYCQPNLTINQGASLSTKPLHFHLHKSDELKSSRFLIPKPPRSFA